MLILASKSPRRKEILEMAGIYFLVVTKEVEEDIEKSNPTLYVEKTAQKKALAVFEEFKDDIILSADTIVTIDNLILGNT